MAIFKKQTNKPSETVIPKYEELHNAAQIEEIKEEKNIEEIKPVESKKEEKKVSIKKGSKVIANGRCFGSPSLECPLKTVRNYETKIIEISDNSVLIDEGWISKDNIK